MTDKIIKAVAAQSDSVESDWEFIEGPDSRVGQDYWLRNEKAKKQAYVNVDHGEMKISVSDEDEFCQENSMDWKHEPDWKSIIVSSDGDETYVDITCIHCGRSGCVGTTKTLAAGISW